MKTQYQQPRARRMESLHLGGRFKAGLAAPVMAHKLKGSESAMIRQRAIWELDPIPGRLLSPMTGTIVSLFVPVQALHALKNPSADYPGSNDVIRAALANGDTLFDLEPEGEITKRLGINPISISGTKKVCESARLAYVAAVNYLRQRLYVNATVETAGNTDVLNAVLSRTVLAKLNAVLDPEDRVNGAVQFDGMIDIHGLEFDPYQHPSGSLQSTLDGSIPTGTLAMRDNVYTKTEGETAPYVWGEFQNGQSISLTDFYEAQKMDALVRKMRQFVDANPEHGEEIVTRWALGLSLDVGRQPFVLYEREVELNQNLRHGMDGASLDTRQTDAMGAVDFTVMVPATEFGGVVVTIMMLKPDEVLASQPNPMFTEAWAQDNFAADELAIDPVPVTIRELYSDCDVGDEGTVAVYTGNHGLKRAYECHGWNRALNTSTVENDSAIWQLAVPMSVTPENVSYPDDLPQTPFADTLAEVVTYSVKSEAVVQTPLIFGPTPVEELAAIETENTFEDVV